MFICFSLYSNDLLLNVYLLYNFLMQIHGVINKIIFSNIETGYSVLEVDTDIGNVKISGKFPVVGEGEMVIANGEFITNKYGRQFLAEQVKIENPQNKENLIRFLSSGLIRGIGPVFAKRIVDMFSIEALSIIENNPLYLTRIKGINERKALEFSQSVNNVKKMQSAVMFLQQYDVTLSLAVKIFECYKSETENVVKNNPYKLVEDIEGVGFKTADKIAIKVGISKNSEFRIRAGIIHCLSLNTERIGSTILSKKELFNQVSVLLELNDKDLLELFDVVLTKIKIDGVLQNIIKESIEYISLTKYVTYEKSIANNLIRIKENADFLIADIDQDILEFEQKKKIKLHDQQKQAIKTAITEGVVIITGGPGTGKTTIVKCIIDIFKKQNKTCLLMAPTGRAAKRLEESTNIEAGTIHRMLEVDFSGGIRRFAHYEKNPLLADVVLVDEVSMLDVFLASSLLRAVRSGARLILVGDKNQLPSVGAGNVLADIISSNLFSVVELTQIFRQTDASQIIINAHRINQGKMPYLSSHNTDFFFSSQVDSNSIKNEVVSLVSKRLPQYFDCDWRDIQILSPIKTGQSGVESLNQNLQEILNSCNSSKFIEYNNKKFMVGDRVMQMNNNYDKTWSKPLTFELGKGVFNGDIGFIVEVDTKSAELVVEFEDGKQVVYNSIDMNELSLAYAITIHKSQGSEFNIVVIPITSGNPFLFNRNLIYTAITRAKKCVVLVGKKENIAFMVANTKMTKRETLLVDFLRKMSDDKISV